MDKGTDIQRARLLAAKIRRDIVKIIDCKGQTGHFGGSCSSADLVAALYAGKMRFKADDPAWPERDKFIYSKGHAAIAQYAAMAETGYFPVQELSTLKRLGTRLQGHPDRTKIPGIEAGTGSLGQGLSIASGMALAMRLDGHHSGRVFCIIGDGELNEGQVWEAAMSGGNFHLDNLIAIVDKNELQATGACTQRFNIDPLPDKWRSFGWHVIEINGHDMAQIFIALDEARAHEGNPCVIIAGTVKGKGFPFAEGVAGFHNGLLTSEQYDEALAIIEKEIDALTREGGNLK